MPQPERKADLDLMRCAGLGAQLAVTVGLFAWGGFELDAWLDTSPLLLITGCLIGVCGGMYSVVRQVNRLTETSEEPPDDTA